MTGKPGMAFTEEWKKGITIVPDTSHTFTWTWGMRKNKFPTIIFKILHPQYDKSAYYYWLKTTAKEDEIFQTIQYLSSKIYFLLF